MDWICRFEPAVAPRRADRLRALRRIIATWRWRARCRRDLEEMAAADPHLIDDIGLTRRQLEAEIAKPFWQA